MEKITSGDLEGGWHPPAPDQGLNLEEQFAFSIVSYCSQFFRIMAEHAIWGRSCGPSVN